ncbi:chalcone synthase [Cytophagales bacterium WSM2-2]|nr:chalcone synthase [Cytophagales bacterium WSM2-2]
MSFITSIGTAVPENKFEQGVIARFMERTIEDEASRRKMRAVFRASAIQHRYSVLSDYGKESGFSFYADTKDLGPFPSTAQRMSAYRQYACPLSLEAIKNCVEPNRISEITHLITVSCTGMYAPGLDIDILNSLSLPTSTERTCINFMGCYAAVNGLKVADAICKSNNDAKVLIVCTELCSLHFQKEFTEDNILANALFADGSAAILVEPNATSRINFSLEGFHGDILNSGEQHMAWGIGDFGFEMRLSSYIPTIVEGGIQRLLAGLIQKTKIRLNQIDYFAVHPGGRKILETIVRELSLEKNKLEDSFATLRSYGNMSSPTMIFVLKEMMKKYSPQNDSQHVLGLAFGPGLTLESVLLKIKVL